MTDEPTPTLTVTFDERGLCLWIGVDALAASRVVAAGPNGPAAPFTIGVDEAHVLLAALHAAIDDRDMLNTRDNPDGFS